MNIKEVKFLVSSAQFDQLPPPNYPEYAFVGRSNVGKSSLINRMSSRKDLARVSSTPGKTQLINHFLVDDAWYLVDLPGYGYAQVSKKQRRKFTGMIKDYVLKRQNVMCLFVLVDSRHEPQANDLQFMQDLGENGVPFCIVFTKIDKIKQSDLTKNLKAYKAKMLEVWEEMPKSFITSSKSGRGVQEILDLIGETNRLWQ